MRLVDSSAWIEWLIGSPVGEIIVEHLPEQDAWLIPTMVQFELAKWLTRECGESIADQVIAFTHVCNIAPLDTEIALAAAEICRLHGLPSADAIILATARAHDADLLTCDRHFEGLPGVILIPKT